MWKKILVRGLSLILLLALVAGGYVFFQVNAYNDSMAKTYDVAPLDIKAATDPAAIERGRHLSRSLAGCALSDCHGADLGGGKTMKAGPIGTITAPNITRVAQAYSDGRLARLIRYGIKKDGRSVRFMPCNEFGWLPDSDVAAVIGYIRTVKPVDRPNGPMKLGIMAKVLDRRGEFDVDVARKVVSKPIDLGPAPSATKKYGSYVARLCTGCHGKHLGGGPLPGAPPDFAVPRNLTPDPTGLGKDYSYEQFTKLIEDGIKKDGTKADPMMPIAALQGMNDTERHALYAYLRSVKPRPFGSR